MEIRSATVHDLRIPLEGAYEISSGAAERMESILVVLTTADGARGVGTADTALGHTIPQSPAEIYEGLVQDLLPTVLAADPSTPNELRSLLDRIPGQENGKCAVEIAFLDRYCRDRGQTVAAFLGGALRETEPLNGWVGIDDPRAMAERARALQDDGFGSVKLKLSGERAVDVKRVQAVREAVGDEMQVRLDANEGYSSLDEAIEAASAFEHCDVAHLEQPLPRGDLEGLRRLTAATDVVVVADEPILDATDGYAYLKADAADRLKFKIVKSGGVLGCRRGLEMAAAADVRCVLGHGFCTTPAASAELQLSTACENVFRPVETVGPLKMGDVPFTPRIDMSGGTATLPSGDGLGTKLQDDRVGEFARESTSVE